MARSHASAIGVPSPLGSSLSRTGTVEAARSGRLTPCASGPPLPGKRTMTPPRSPRDDPAASSRLPSRAVRPLLAFIIVMLVLAWQADLFTSRIAAGETQAPSKGSPDQPSLTVAAWRGARERRLVGAVVARERVELAPELSGRIERINVSAGDRIEAGDTLAVLDGRVASARAERSEAALARATAEARGAERLLASIREAAAARSIPQTERIDAERAQQAAARAVEEAQAMRDEAVVRLGFTRLVSPIAGVVLDTLADPGDLATPERAMLVLYRPDRLEVAVNVPASLASQIAPGAELELALPGLGEMLTGTVRTLIPAADPTPRSVLAKLTAALPARAVPGLYAEARLAVPADPSEAASVIVPEQAVERVRQLAFVYVVRDAGGAERRLVRLGSAIGDRVLVHAGLRPGEEILARVPASREASER